MGTKCLILTPGRCGSELLIHALKKHPEISVAIETTSEIFHNTFKKRIPDDAIGDIIRKISGEQNKTESTPEFLESIKTIEYIQAIFEKYDVIKILDYHLHNKTELLYDIVSTIDNLVIIRLSRKNIFQMYVSSMLSKQIKVWATIKRIDVPTIKIDRQEIINRANYHKKYDKIFNDLKQKCGSQAIFYNIYYEDIIADWDNSISKIESLLDISDVSLEQTNKKIIQKPMPLVVSNFDELALSFRGTKFENDFERTYFSSDWFSHAVPEFQRFLSCYKDKHAKFLEIGSYEGRSAIWTLNNILTHPKSTLCCIEPGFSRNDNNLLLEQNLTCTNLIHKVNLYKYMSNVILCRLNRSSYDFIYIDGSHDTDRVLYDSVLSFELLKTGGIIAFDDYEWNGKHSDGTRPHSAIDAFLTNYAKRIKILHKKYQVWIKKL